MDCKEIFINGLEDILGEMEHILSGLTNEDLSWQPRPDCNSIGWLAWHLTRVEDDHIAYIMDKEQLWTKEGWHEKFDRPADAKDRGFGHTPEQVANFKCPDVQTFLDYHKAVFERAKNYLLSRSETDFDRPLDQYWQGIPVKVGWRLTSTLEDCLEHVGQMAYIRGLLQGKGWQKY